MTDTDSIEQFSTAHQQCSDWTTDQKEKIKIPRFAFLIISASAHFAHLQSRTNQPHHQSFTKEPNFASALKMGTLNRKT